MDYTNFSLLNDLNHKELEKLLAVIMLSEGYVMNHNHHYFFRLVTLAENKEQHRLFSLICKKIYEKEPKEHIEKRFSYGGKEKKDYLCSKFCSKSAVLDLIKLSPTFKTTPGFINKNEFKKIQPTCKFLFNENEEFKKLALKLWFDFDGSISPTYKVKMKTVKIKGVSKYKYIICQFEIESRIAETNPALVNELIELFKSMDIKATIRKDKRKWSSIDGIRISEKKSMFKFLKEIGPFTDVKVAKSTRLKGYKKQAVCKAALYLLENEKDIYKCFNNIKEAQNYRKIKNEELIKLVNLYNK